MTIRAPIVTRIERQRASVSVYESGRGSQLTNGQDSFYYGAGRGAQHDYPNPRAKYFPVALLTWAEPLKINLTGQDDGGGRWIELGNPIGGRPFIPRDAPLNLLSSTLGVVQPKPFDLQEWPVPKGAAHPIALRTWVDPLRQNLQSPDQFSFTDQTGVEVSSTITSAAVTITGIDAPVTITVTGGTYSINGGAFTADPGTVVNGDEVRARHTSSASYLTATNTAVTIGGVSDTFTSTTRTEPAAGGGSTNAPTRLGGIMIFG